MRPMVEFCVNNMHHGTDEVLKQLEQNPDVDVLEYGCLGNCGECYMFPFAYVNGDMLTAQSSDELMTKIMEKIDEIKAWEQLDID
ncbi:YuzB family protein [Paenibacillus sp. 481]|uniref:YuzB family protein n=1 Tax=Paenibacillus sp. 481 TaxID=2835869 RepID=UPI001E5212BC|nr:YuzB family protein [Paenibacillus sp. 481]UHA74605.1 YuzB family protein [Paenibacillus sp. 481]